MIHGLGGNGVTYRLANLKSCSVVLDAVELFDIRERKREH